MNPRQEVEIVGRHLELTEVLKTKVNEMAAKLHEHDSGTSRIRVELEHQRHAATHQDEFIAKVRMEDRHDYFVVSNCGYDLYQVIAELGEKLDRLIRQRRRRRVSERRHPAAIDLECAIPKTGTNDA